MDRVETQDVNVENPNVGKTTAAHRLQNTLWERSTTTRIHRGNDLLSSSSPHAAVTVEATTSVSVSLSLSLSVHLLYNCSTTTDYNNNTTTTFINTMKVCALSHIYTYMTFRHIYICVLLNRSKPIGTGSCINRFSVSSIRRDMFPNKLPLHSGMGCRASPIRFRHASSLSGVSTLVSMSDPFSVVWIFVSTNSHSSTHSRIQ